MPEKPRANMHFGKQSAQLSYSAAASSAAAEVLHYEFAMNVFPYVAPSPRQPVLLEQSIPKDKAPKRRMITAATQAMETEKSIASSSAELPKPKPSDFGDQFAHLDEKHITQVGINFFAIWDSRAILDSKGYKKYGQPEKYERLERVFLQCLDRGGTRGKGDHGLKRIPGGAHTFFEVKDRELDVRVRTKMAKETTEPPVYTDRNHSERTAIVLNSFKRK